MQPKSLAVENRSDVPKIKKQPEKSWNNLASNIKTPLYSSHIPIDLMQVLFEKKEKEIHP